MYSYLDPNGNTFWCAEDIGTNTIIPANWTMTGGWYMPNNTDDLAFIGFANPGGLAQIQVATTPYQLYKFSFVVNNYTGTTTYNVNIFTGTFINTIALDINANGVYEYYFIPNAAFTDIVITAITPPATTVNDNVTITNISFDLLNVNIVRDRLRCANLIIDPCNGTPGGGGLPGDCGASAINNGLILCEQTDSWNCNLCGNDLPYYNPVLETDPFMFQFQQWDYYNGQYPWTGTGGWGISAFVEVFDCCTDALITSDINLISIGNFVGIYNTKGYNGLDNWTNIQQISFDLSSIKNAGLAFNANWDGCFYLKFFFLDANGDPYYTFYSEPYRFEKCDDTILLEGGYSKKDCFGYWYYDSAAAAPPNTVFVGNGTYFPFRNTYRVKGSYELTGFEINKEFVGVRQFTANTERQEIWMLRTNRIPSRVARLISNILAAQTVYVEGRDYIASGTISKNNETGNQWFLESQLKRVTCSQTTSCD